MHLDRKESDCMDHHVEVLSLYLKKINLKTFQWDKRLQRILTWRRFGVAVCKRIACILFWAWANWSMIDNSADCIETTSAKTWISTFFIYTCSITRTFRVDWTFRATVGRGSNVSRQTWAWRRSVDITALREWTTWRWVARVTIWVLSRWYDRG